MKFVILIMVGFLSQAFADSAYDPECNKMYGNIYDAFQAESPHSRDKFAKVKSEALQIAASHPACKDKIHRLLKEMDKFADFDPPPVNGKATPMDCKRVQYSELDGATTLANKKKSEEDKFNAQMLKTYTDSYNELCEKTKCLMARDKLSLDKVLDKHIATLDWAKTPYQKQLQYKFFKDLDLEHCVK